MMGKRQNKILLHLLFIIVVTHCSWGQVPNPALIGYFHNWQDANAPYIQLDAIDSRYNIIDVAFAIPQAGTDYKMQFIPDQVSTSTFIAQIQTLQAQGKKVLISIGGATAPISLDNIMERDTFISTLTNIIDSYGFDGLDIDLEGSSLSVTGGTIASPVDQPITNLIYAIRQIMANFYISNGHQLILTMAPETAFVQGGQSAYGGIWGAYLPVINALSDSLHILHVQLYNSGSMYGIDGGIYSQGTADFIVAMTEAVIQGFNTNGGHFPGLPASKVAIGLPACTMAAGGGFLDSNLVIAAIKYLIGQGPQPGNYTLLNPSGYPQLRGMMTWSINWDAVSTCNSIYEYASTYQQIFETTMTKLYSDNMKLNYSVAPNPATHNLQVSFNEKTIKSNTYQIFNVYGQVIDVGILTQTSETIDISSLEQGIYFLKTQNMSFKFSKI